MGAVSFDAYSDGVDVKDAFTDAVENAKSVYGRAGYTGTIAEKDQFVIVAATPMPYDEAEQLAYKLIGADDPRIADKYGPAGAIPILGHKRTLQLDIPYREDGYPSQEEAVAEGLKSTGELRDGERFSQICWGVFDTDKETDKITGGTLVVSVTRDEPTHVGWLFFGYAAT